MSTTAKPTDPSAMEFDIVHSARTACWSPRLAEVCRRFGICPTAEGTASAHHIALPLRPGTVTLVCGPSGAGKTRLLAELTRQIAGVRCVASVRFPRESAILDCVGPRDSLGSAISLLTACGLGEPRHWISRYAELSEGERFRARLVRTIQRHLDSRHRAAPLICDELGSVLHRRLARAVAFNLGKVARRHGLALIVATSHDDLAEDLNAEVVVRLRRDAEPHVETRRIEDRPFSLSRSLHIEPGHKRDYEAFAAMHYRQRDELGFVDRIFVVRDGVGGEALGVIVYAYGPIGLALRNAATGGRFRGDPQRLNRELRIIRRLVIHPDIRGCGIGHWLVRQTLPKVEVPFVECLATMGLINPVFEKAGMERIGVCPPAPSRERLSAWLRQHGADPLAADFEDHVERQPAVRTLVSDTVARWYEATTGAGRDRVGRQSPRLLAHSFRQLIGSQPVYYLWRRRDRPLTRPGEPQPP